MAASQRTQALRIFGAGVAAADPGAAVRRALETAPLSPCQGRTVVVALGKAAVGMAEAALEILGGADRVLAATNHENLRQVPGIEVLGAGHPVPDDAGARAARAVEAALSHLTPEDRVLVLVSGGGSALLPAPVAGVTLAQKAEVNRLLLASGADITEMDLVRQHLSRLKGGGLLRAADPAPVTALILSDVLGDDLRVIASGPTVSPIGTRGQARSALETRGIWDDLPETVRRHLAVADPGEARPRTADNRLVGSNAISVAAMARAAGIAPAAEPLVGDVAEAAAVVLAAGAAPGVYLWGGETTVVLRGSGMGGRNQELALRVALGAEAAGWTGDWVFLSGGTDGRDGPTDAAGGIVDGGTLNRIRAAGLDPMACLADNDSYRALKAAEDLLVTGGTGTNVADLQVLIRRG